MTQESDEKDRELQQLPSKAGAGQDEIRDRGEHEQRQDTLIERLRREAEVRDDELSELQWRLAVAEHELEDLRAIRDALAPSQLPQRPGLELAAAFVPAAEQVSGDFYLVAEGPQDATVLVIGDVVGHGLQAARRAAFTRTAFIATAPFTDDPWRLLSWANTALVERAGTSANFVTAACMTYLPHQRLLRFAYAGHPPAVRMSDGRELIAPSQGVPLGIHPNPEYAEGTLQPEGPTGILLYTDGLTEARGNGTLFGLEGVTAVLSQLDNPAPSEAVATLRARVSEFADNGTLVDDLCMLAARIN